MCRLPFHPAEFHVLPHLHPDMRTFKQSINMFVAWWLVAKEAWPGDHEHEIRTAGGLLILGSSVAVRIMATHIHHHATTRKTKASSRGGPECSYMKLHGPCLRSHGLKMHEWMGSKERARTFRAVTRADAPYLPLPLSFETCPHM